jgi:hypothetical protein
MSGFMYNDSINQFESKLILCIDELETNGQIDTRLFVGWDETSSKYFIKGKRLDTESLQFVPYSFLCESKHDVYLFIICIIDKHNRINYTLYNFNNITFRLKEDLSYEFFERHMDREYEIIGYDDESINKRNLYNMFTLMRNVYN